MKKKNVVGIIVSVVVVAIIVSFVALVYNAPEEEEEELIKIGYCGPMDDDMGKAGERSVLMAIEEINEAGGLLGRQLEMVGPLDTAFDPAEAIKAYDYLVWTADVDLVVTGNDDDCDAATMPRVAETDTITIAGWTTTVECYDKVWQDYEKYKNWFGVSSNDWGLCLSCLDFLENFCKKELGWDSIIIFREDLVWTYGVKDMLYEECPKLGLEVKGDIVFPIDTVDYGPMFHMCETSGADGIFTLVAAVAEIPSAQYMKLQVPMPMVGISPSGTKYEFWEDTGGCVGVASQYSLAGLKSDRMNAFVEKYFERYTTRPRYPMHPGFSLYRGMIAWAEAVERCGSLDPEILIPEMERGYGEFYMEWPGMPGGWFGLHRPASPEAVPEGHKVAAYDGPWEGVAMSPHTWGHPKLTRWCEWAPSDTPGGEGTITEPGYGKCICIWPEEYADGEYILPPWLE